MKESFKLGENSINAGKTVKIIGGEFKGEDYRIENWVYQMSGKSWMDCNGNPACLEYAMRAGFENKPADNNVYYGKIGAFGKLMHISDLELMENQNGF